MGLFCAWEKAPFLLLLSAGLFLWRRELLVCALILPAFAYGLLSFREIPRVPPPATSFHARAEVRLLDFPLRKRGYSRARAEVRRLEGKDVAEGTLAELYFHPAREFDPGTVLLVEGLFKSMKAPLNPFAYDSARLKISRHVLYRARITEAQVLARETSLLEQARASLFRFSQGLSPEAQGLFEALVLGSRLHLPESWRTKFERQGIFHLLAISGMHLGLLVASVWVLIRALARLHPKVYLLFPERNLVLLAAAPFILFYTLLSGPTPSALRAALMLAGLLLAGGLYREIRSLDLLALAVLVILLAHPATIGSLSFRLSVSAVAALILASRWRRSFNWPRRRPWRYVADVFYFSLAANLATAPWLLGLKGEVALLSPFYNLLALPLFGFLILPLEFLAAVAAFFSPATGRLPAELAALAVRLLPEGPTLTLSPPYPLGAFCLAFAPFVLLGLPLKRRLLLALGLSALLHLFFWGEQRDLFVLFDVGQGSAALLRAGERAFLFDAGPRFGGYDAGKLILAPALKKLGIKTLEKVIVSHPQADHVGGLPAILREFRVKEIVSGSPLPWPHRLLREETVLRTGRLTLHLFPEEGDSNEASLVARACFPQWCVLLPGDIGFARERRLLAANKALASRVLVLSHHGSRYANSRPFLRKVAPEVALSSSARTYHPAAQTLARLRELGIPHRGTKKWGAISLLGGRRIFLCTERARRKEALLKRALWPYLPAGCERWKTSSPR